MDLTIDNTNSEEGIESDNDYDNNEIFGTSGLINLGNTCYMNSIIQCLSNCEDFRSYIIGRSLVSELINNTEYESAKYELENSLAFQLRKIFINIWNSSFSRYLL